MVFFVLKYNGSCLSIDKLKQKWAKFNIDSSVIKHPKTTPGLLVKSLMKYLRLLTAEVEKMVLNELPEKFGIVIDG